MGSGVSLYYYAGGGALLLLFIAGFWFLRRRRIRKWEDLLEQPASEIADLLKKKRGPPSWAQALPEDLFLKTEGSFFEVLYLHFEGRPETPIPRALESKLSASSDQAKLVAPIVHAPTTDEEKIKGLIGLPSAGAALPAEAFAQNFVVHLVNVLKGKQKLKQGLEQAAIDCLAPGGGFAGAKVGTAVGLALAPFLVGMAGVFMPVTMVAGAWLGAWTGKKVGTHFKARRYLAILKRLRRVSKDFQKWFIRQIPVFLSNLDRDYALAVNEAKGRKKNAQGRFGRVLYPNFMVIFHGQEIERLKQDRAIDRKQLKQLLALIRAQDPLQFAAVLPTLNRRLLGDFPEFEEFRSEYQAAMQELEDFQKGLTDPTRNPEPPRSEGPQRASMGKDPQSRKPAPQRRSSS